MGPSPKEKNFCENFVRLLDAPNQTVASGRHEYDAGKEGAIWSDILKKLCPDQVTSFFNIGCGFSALSDLCAEHCEDRDIELCVMDAKEILARVRSDWSSDRVARIEFLEGYFPGSLPSSFWEERKFDRILAYSVIHYVDDPLGFVVNAAQLLSSGGSLLIGDIPNPNKRARFLASELGRRFQAGYEKVDINQIPAFKNADEYLRVNGARLNLTVGDKFIEEVTKKCHAYGMEIYLLPQTEGLPFSHTRDDLLIVRYD